MAHLGIQRAPVTHWVLLNKPYAPGTAELRIGGPTFYIMTTKMTPKRFAIVIDDLVRDKNLTHLEAVIHYCEHHGLESNTITRWIDKSLKEKLQYDAESLNYLPKTSRLSGL